jgi:transcriptional regulator with XRE-family HTH domain
MAVKQHPLFLGELARRLKALREERHLTQQEVYDATGVHVGRLESGKRNVALLTVAVLCRYYRIELGLVVANLEQLVTDTLA